MQNPEDGLLQRRSGCEWKKLQCRVLVAGKFEDVCEGKNKNFLPGQEDDELLYYKFTKRGHWKLVNM